MMQRLCQLGNLKALKAASAGALLLEVQVMLEAGMSDVASSAMSPPCPVRAAGH